MIRSIGPIGSISLIGLIGCICCRLAADREGEFPVSWPHSFPADFLSFLSSVRSVGIGCYRPRKSAAMGIRVSVRYER